MAEWKVNAGYQVPFGDQVHVGGDTFTATELEIDEILARPYVTQVVRQQSAPAAANKAVAAPVSHEVKKPPAEVTKTPAEPVKKK